MLFFSSKLNARLTKSLPCSQASSSKLPNFLRLLIARLIAFHDKHPLSSSALLDFLTAQLATLQPILDAPRPAGRSNLVNSNLAGALALPAAFAAAARGAAGLTQLDKEFSKVASEVAQGLKEILKCVFSPSSLRRHRTDQPHFLGTR